MGEKITIVEIAKMANVSTATVSRIINNSGRVTDKKRKAVMEVIEKYSYKPNFIAKSLQSSKSNTVGFIVPHINSPYYAQMFYETELIAQKSGFTLMLCNSESDQQLESHILDVFLSTKVRAIVFMGGSLDNADCNKEFLQEIQKVNKEIPVISCVKIPRLTCTQIYQTDKKSDKELIEHLADNGCRDVALLGGYANVRTTSRRRKEVIDIIHQYGMTLRDEIIECDYSVDGGSEAMQCLLKQGHLPQAIICINDLVATGVLNEAYKNNIKVPEDVAIVGYDNMDISQFIYPGITTVACDYKGYAEAILEVIKNFDSNNKKKNIEIPSKLIVRGTTQSM